MTMDKAEDAKAAPGPGMPAEDSKASPEDRLHLPGHSILNRPVLRVKPAGSRADATPASPSVRAGTLYANDGNAEPPVASEKAATAPEDDMHLQKTIVLPPPDQRDQLYLYATHRVPPPDEAAEKEQLAAIGGSPTEKRVSAGFLLGIALIVLALFCGVTIGRLNRKVASLEQRISSLESGGARPMASAGLR